MWPFFVVLCPPIGDLDACIEQVARPTNEQALFSQPAVKALHVGILNRLAGLDVAQVSGLSSWTPMLNNPPRCWNNRWMSSSQFA